MQCSWVVIDAVRRWSITARQTGHLLHTHVTRFSSRRHYCAVFCFSDRRRCPHLLLRHQMRCHSNWVMRFAMTSYRFLHDIQAYC